jgi:branched-chain amino acid transport system permease protein
VFAPEGIAGLIERLVGRAVRATPASSPRELSTPSAQPEATRSPSTEKILSLRDVAKKFGGVVALDGIDLEIGAGELVGIIGPNGSGKTTLINVVSGLYRPDSGQVVFDGQDITGQPPFRIARAGIGRGFQTPRLLESLTVFDNIAVAVSAASPAASPAAVSAAPSRKNLLLPLLEKTRLLAVLPLLLGGLPGGVLRRVEIARAMMGRPRLLLLDEPAAGLTQAEQDELRQILTELNRDGVAILVIEHSVAFLSQLAPRLVCLVEGRVVADGTPAQVTSHPQVIAAYLGKPVASRP